MHWLVPGEHFPLRTNEGKSGALFPPSASAGYQERESSGEVKHSLCGAVPYMVCVEEIESVEFLVKAQ